MFVSEKRIKKALTKSMVVKCVKQSIDIKDLRLAIVSDHHMGQRDDADDFKNNESTYKTALEYYLNEDFKICLLGDVEELWECRPKKVLHAYEEVLKLEQKFAEKGNYLRFTGNHDDFWESGKKVIKYLKNYIAGDISTVYESLLLTINSDETELGKLFIIHGHQGTLFSDILACLSKPFVRYIWRPIQRSFRIGYSSPANNFHLREKHERMMYQWAAAHSGIILITGHTHHPVFTSQSHESYLAYQIRELNKKLEIETDIHKKEIIQSDIDKLSNRLDEKLREFEGVKFDVGPIFIPLYFNSGCCSFSDGDITAIELSQEKIKLIRWPIGKQNSQILREDNLRAVLERCE
jgi:UDP-2,3-diacylglucosamine pyrophosphatase LpxH